MTFRFPTCLQHATFIQALHVTGEKNIKHVSKIICLFIYWRLLRKQSYVQISRFTSCVFLFDIYTSRNFSIVICWLSCFRIFVANLSWNFFFTTIFLSLIVKIIISHFISFEYTCKYAKILYFVIREIMLYLSCII